MLKWYMDGVIHKWRYNAKNKFRKKEEIERLLLITIIGMMESLLLEAINIKDAQYALFSPYTIYVLKKKKINKKIIDLIKEGCELEDIKSLLPENLETTILQIKENALELLKRVDDYQNEYKVTKWIVND